MELLRSTIVHHEQEIHYLKDCVERMAEQVAIYKNLAFGVKSERYIQVPIDVEEALNQEQSEQETSETAQADVVNEESAPKEKEKKEKKPRKRRIRANTTHQVEHVIIPDEVKENPSLFRQLPESMNKTSRRLEFEPAHLALHIFTRPAFERIEQNSSAPKKSFAPICAPAPASILPGSNMGTSILAYVMHAKFCLFLPFYRIEKELERMGLYGVDDVLINNWHRAVSEALEPVYNSLHSLILESPALHIDETPFRCLKSSKKHGYMWALSCAETGMNLYYWGNSRGVVELDSLLHEGMTPSGAIYQGAILTDGYKVYQDWLNSLEPDTQKRIRHHNCWAHVRRKFVECARFGNDPQWSHYMVDLISPLYQMERELKESQAPPDVINEVRRNEALPHLARIFTELEKKEKDEDNPPRNKLKDAIAYTLARREALCNWVTNPVVPLDNNPVERAIRPLTIGRKNCLFIGAPDAGKRSAILYTMVEECKRVGQNPQLWLEEVLRRLPTHRASQGYTQLLPGLLPITSNGKQAELVQL